MKNKARKRDCVGAGLSAFFHLVSYLAAVDEDTQIPKSTVGLEKYNNYYIKNY